MTMGDSRISFVAPLPKTYADRVQRLRSGLDQSMKIMEIGGSYNALVPRSAGYDTYIVDHATQEELQEKYKDIAPGATIERVDCVCNDGNLIAAVPDALHGTFDACLASHVIEHIPNPIAFMRSVERMLKPSGIFTMAVPDKRQCFDFFRPLTGTGNWLQAYLCDASTHSATGHFDFESYTVSHNGTVMWHTQQLNNFSFASRGLKAAFKIMKEVGESTSGKYVDIHAWVFVPASFSLIMYEAHALGLTTLIPQNLHSQGAGEFIVDLVKDPTHPPISDADRIRLMKQAAREQLNAFALIGD